MKAVAGDATVLALHGPRADDGPISGVVPVLNSIEQLAHWRAHGRGTPCDVMVDTGMNRLGIDWREISTDMLDDLNVGTIHSHLACADDPTNPLNEAQLARFREIVRDFRAVRPDVNASLCGSGGICLGEDYIFDLTRPGLGLYGGVPNPTAEGELEQVVRPIAEIILIREVRKGDSVGYGATWTAEADTRVATMNIGYADGAPVIFSNLACANLSGERCAIVGRVSMDLMTIDIGTIPAAPGDEVELSFRLPEAAALSGRTQYELLTGLGSRYQRRYR
ncbi:MAG: alanine racemase C-terminal domain-containing protein [Pacificimonas sp.]